VVCGVNKKWYLKQRDQVGLRSLLQRQDRDGLESQVILEVLGDFTDEALEGQLAQQELCPLLVLSDFTQGNGSRAISVGLLHATRGWCGLASRFGRELLARSLAAGGLSCCLFGASHGREKETKQKEFISCSISNDFLSRSDSAPGKYGSTAV